MVRFLIDISYQTFIAGCLYTFLVHDGSDMGEWCFYHVLGLDMFRQPMILDKVLVPYPLCVIKEILVRSKGRTHVTIDFFYYL